MARSVLTGVMVLPLAYYCLVLVMMEAAFVIAQHNQAAAVVDETPLPYECLGRLTAAVISNDPESLRDLGCCKETIKSREAVTAKLQEFKKNYPAEIADKITRVEESVYRECEQAFPSLKGEGATTPSSSSSGNHSQGGHHSHAAQHDTDYVYLDFEEPLGYPCIGRIVVSAISHDPSPIKDMECCKRFVGSRALVLQGYQELSKSYPPEASKAFTEIFDGVYKECIKDFPQLKPN